MAIELRVNGTMRRVEAAPGATLLTVLRDHLELTGTKYGCGEGQCGACTVLIDGKPARACITRAASVAGKQITTIEGLAQNGRLHPLQQAFVDAGAMQCGYCTTGMIMAGVGLLERNGNPSEQQVKQALEGNICRCGTYPRIVTAVQLAARSRGEGRRG